ncbi:MAG: proline--tRNA ligase [Candidatus Cloacimonetes bacterium 4572_65]|nr:MAG: proline--tRNA ligase [Candidatus Cloacimonetes bacterium 4572_65]
MAKKQRTAIEPTREQDYAEWYQQVVRVAELAENSDVRGCMVIKPWGYAIWENIQKILDKMFKEQGVKNAYFPLFIPKSYFEKEAEHVEGFAKECAVVTHTRLEDDGNGGLKEAGKLAEPYIVRPTSETIIGASFSKWINSYRDLPLLINQWANVVRWELRTRLFLRTSEFLWQEGHTVHATEAEAITETELMLDVYGKFSEEILAIPVIKGEKSAGERFPGAVATYSIEAMMQDRKALQAGTSHFLGQNFAKASEIKFQNKEGEYEHAWTTSWGVSTRLIGALIMAHSDDNGLVLPPRIAPAHIVIIPIYKNDEDRDAILAYIKNITEALKEKNYDGKEILVEVDDSDITSGEKSWKWIKRGMPIRLEIGKRDMASESVFVGRRDLEPRDKKGYGWKEFVDNAETILTEIQDSIFKKALDFRAENTKDIDSREEFDKFFTPKGKKKPGIHGGFASSHWCGSKECEDKIKDDLKVTIRNIPLDSKEEQGSCICCGKPSNKRVIFSKSY